METTSVRESSEAWSLPKVHVHILQKVEKRQLWVRPFEWLKLNFASRVVHHTRLYNTEVCLIWTKPTTWLLILRTQFQLFHGTGKVIRACSISCASKVKTNKFLGLVWIIPFHPPHTNQNNPTNPNPTKPHPSHILSKLESFVFILSSWRILVGYSPGQHDDFPRPFCALILYYQDFKTDYNNRQFQL